MTPIELPDTPSGIARVRFEIERVDFAAPEAGGRQGGVQAGWPLWRATYELDRSDPNSADLWQAFFDRLRGRMRRFYAGDPTRRFPRSAPNGFAGLLRYTGGAFDGSASTWSQAINSDGDALITLDGLPLGFALAPGDWIGWKWTTTGLPLGTFDKRTMARVVQAAAGGSLTVMVEPPVDTRVVPAGAIAHLDRPQCVMQLVPEQSSLGPIGAGGAVANGRIMAIQDLRA